LVDEGSLVQLARAQESLLARAAAALRPGARLVYATCSLLPEENEVQVEAFLASHPAFRAIPLAQAWEQAGLPGAPPTTAPHMLLSPGAHGTDGFFCAVLERWTPEPVA
jgi:16S rRNA (cytosine967-C5)-methyltransferase